MTNDFKPTTESSEAIYYRRVAERLRRQLDLAIECLEGHRWINFTARSPNDHEYATRLNENEKEYVASTIRELLEKATGGDA